MPRPRTVAQLVEHDTFNVGVAGPIPASPTTRRSKRSRHDSLSCLSYSRPTARARPSLQGLAFIPAASCILSSAGALRGFSCGFEARPPHASLSVSLLQRGLVPPGKCPKNRLQKDFVVSNTRPPLLQKRRGCASKHTSPENKKCGRPFRPARCGRCPMSTSSDSSSSS